MWKLVGMLPVLWTGSAALSAQTIPFDSGRWEIIADSFRTLDYLGQKALYLRGGFASVMDLEFTDGVVEFDICVSGERGFMGVMWRASETAYEEFYIRPHQSGNPDANQYTPVFNGLAAWQLYYGEGYGVPVKYTFDHWMHVKIEVVGTRADIYVIDMNQPAVRVRELKSGNRSGRVGLSNGGQFAGAYYANFSVRSTRPVLEEIPYPTFNPLGIVARWQVSTAFPESLLTDRVVLTTEDKKNLTWTSLGSEPGGITNLARIQGNRNGVNTAFARFALESETEQALVLQFGYSDRVRVYCNDRLLYAGNNNYLSRDYRYLGTIGWFDAVALPLRKGRNEIWMAVSENFGGWGIMGKFENVSTIRFID